MNEDIAAFGVEQTDNKHMRIYHTRMVLTDSVAQLVSNCEGINEQTEGLAEYVLGIRGVTQVQIERHRFGVIKSPMYEWEEIHPKIAELLKWARVPESLIDPVDIKAWLSDGSGEVVREESR
jgi:Scaffold protein Nfu/NifU N terminal